ncbi:uncharacterized protein SAPINGB_P001106 [Magnusiomyces paraingens]|uniref:N-acetylgalactosaminide beta-1,3-galactosyltransferase n=1 Tax=Magnusiomyces paraingens TaxID=2606893 RepID=A0A5E8BAB3_9ASCO|nr:uncharacterized protein SAPINGB_P001106 [Saprochaete ingens]VVT46221.1 unnamed protein product [Saprochaete ingens]
MRISPKFLFSRRRRSFTIIFTIITLTFLYIFVLPLRSHPSVQELAKFTEKWEQDAMALFQKQSQQEQEILKQQSDFERFGPADGDDPNGLQPQDFSGTFDPSYKDTPKDGRFASHDAWRPDDSYDIDIEALSRLRPHAPRLAKFRNKAEYLRQPIVADYPANASTLFVMMKEGANVLWNRVPVHLLTSFTQIPYFALYADIGGSIAGHEVIDILANVTDETKSTKDFQLYHKLNSIRDTNVILDPGELKVSGGWALDKYKNMPMLHHAYQTAPSSVNWFIFMDGDSYFFWENLIEYLSTLDPTKPIYLGSPTSFRGVAFAHGGTGVVISRKAMDMTLGEHPEWVHELEEETSRSCCGDYMVGYMLKQANISLSKNEQNNVKKKFQGESLWSIEAGNHTWCDQIISFHHLSPLDVEILWEYERLIGPEKRKSITYSDIYRDFVQPYIVEERADWNNYAKDKTFSEDKDKKDIENKRKKEEEKRKREEEKKAKREAEKEEEAGGKKEKRDDTQGKSETEKRREQEELKKKEEAIVMELVKKLGSRPYHSLDLCKKECEKWDQCLSWRYFPELKTCGLGKTAKLGRPTNDAVRQKFENNKEGVYKNSRSGWRIERIRKIRKIQKCDIIYNDTRQANDEQYLQFIKDNQVEDNYEGWYVRKQFNKGKVTDKSIKFFREAPIQQQQQQATTETKTP